MKKSNRERELTTNDIWKWTLKFSRLHPLKFVVRILLIFKKKFNWNGEAGKTAVHEQALLRILFFLIFLSEKPSRLPSILCCYAYKRLYAIEYKNPLLLTSNLARQFMGLVGSDDGKLQRSEGCFGQLEKITTRSLYWVCIRAWSVLNYIDENICIFVWCTLFE